MRASAAFLASRLLYELIVLSHNDGSLCHKLISVSISESFNFLIVAILRDQAYVIAYANTALVADWLKQF